MYASIFHWQPILNGYSGFYPRSYIELIEMMREFPSERSHRVPEATRGRSHRAARHLHEARRARGLGRGAERAAGYRGPRGVPGVRRPGHRVQTEPLHTRVNGTATSPVRANAASATRRCVAAVVGRSHGRTQAEGHDQRPGRGQPRRDRRHHREHHRRDAARFEGRGNQTHGLVTEGSNRHQQRHVHRIAHQHLGGLGRVLANQPAGRRDRPHEGQVSWRHLADHALQRQLRQSVRGKITLRSSVSPVRSNASLR